MSYDYYRPGLPGYFKDYMNDLRNLSEEQLKSLTARTQKPYRVLVLSDIHGPLRDRKAFDCALNVIRGFHFDEIILNGDILDFPYVSSYRKKILEDHPFLLNYSEIGEIKDARDNIFKPIKEAAGKDTKITYRLGNHEERFTSPKEGRGIADRILSCQNHFETTKLNYMLGLPDMGIEYDTGERLDLFGVCQVIHGNSIAQNAPRQNLRGYFCSGTSGHTHRLAVEHFTTPSQSYFWLETGCLRLLTAEYLPTAKPANWQQGFGVLNFWIEEDEVKVFANPVLIQDGKCVFDGNLIAA